LTEAVLLALGASLAWGVGDFVGPWQGKTFGVLRVMLWAQLGGLLLIAIAVAMRGHPPDDWAVLWAVVAAVSGTLGLVAFYRGMATGTMSVVAPIAGASAIVPVVYGIATGDHPSRLQVVGMATAILGVALAAREQQEGGSRLAAGVGLALLAAIGFGLYFPPMHAAGAADPWWSAFVFRLTATVVVLIAVAVRRPPLRLVRWPLVIVAAAGCADTLGNLLFAASSAHGVVSVTSVLASLYPIVTVILAAVVLKERIGGAQRVGVVLTLAGIVLISA
jgi:drug/metabolite transporter (DMT)-like permease